MTNEKETVAKAPRGRPARKTVGVRSRLSVTNKDPNYEYRLVTDKDGRVDQLMEHGWEIATGKEQIGVSRLSVPTQEGSVKSTSVGNGDKGVLMRIPKEYYEEDQRYKQELINEKETAITQDRSDGKYGEIRIRTQRTG